MRRDLLSEEGLPDPQERLSILEHAEAVQQAARLLMRRLDQAERQGLPISPSYDGSSSPSSAFLLRKGKAVTGITEWPQAEWTGAVRA